MSKKGGSIHLSEKFGLNPAMSVCFWCNEVNGIALLGKHKGEDGADSEAPKYLYTSYDPCPECLSKMEQGVTLIEVVSHSNNCDVPYISEQGNLKLVPTGRWVVMGTEAAHRAFGGTVHSKAFISTEVMAKIIEDASEGSDDATKH